MCPANVALPEEFTGYDENGVNDCTESRNQHIPPKRCLLSHPAERGMHIEDVSFHEKDGSMMTDVRVVEAARETTLRSMKGGVDGTEERVLSLRIELVTWKFVQLERLLWSGGTHELVDLRQCEDNVFLWLPLPATVAALSLRRLRPRGGVRCAPSRVHYFPCLGHVQSLFGQQVHHRET